MPVVRIRLFGSGAEAEELIGMLHGLDEVEHIEEVADLMPHMDDEDSSSADLPDDIGPGVHAIEVDVPSLLLAERVRKFIEHAAPDLDARVEIVDEF